MNSLSLTPQSTHSDLSSPSQRTPSPDMLTDYPIIVCNAPLVSPIPLPYNSPHFLEFDLPDIDEDLSHPPYTSRQPLPVSRKRKACPELELALPDAKRRPSYAGTTAQHAQHRQLMVLPQRRMKHTLSPHCHRQAVTLHGHPVSRTEQQMQYYYAVIP